MNRRKFLQSLFATGALTAIDIPKAIDVFLVETSKLTDTEFVEYIRFSMNLYCSNPASCVIISDIGEP